MIKASQSDIFYQYRFDVSQNHWIGYHREENVESDPIYQPELSLKCLIKLCTTCCKERCRTRSMCHVTNSNG